MKIFVASRHCDEEFVGFYANSGRAIMILTEKIKNMLQSSHPNVFVYVRGSRDKFLISTENHHYYVLEEIEIVKD